ncbi:hypothetical protein D3C72_2008360 [compost metagenome]
MVLLHRNHLGSVDPEDPQEQLRQVSAPDYRSYLHRSGSEAAGSKPDLSAALRSRKEDGPGAVEPVVLVDERIEPAELSSSHQKRSAGYYVILRAVRFP